MAQWSSVPLVRERSRVQFSFGTVRIYAIFLICFLYCKFMASSIHADVARYHQRLLVARVKHLPIFHSYKFQIDKSKQLRDHVQMYNQKFLILGLILLQKGLYQSACKCPFFKDAAAELLRFTFNLPDLNSVFGQIIPTARPTFHTQTRQVVSKLGTRRRMCKDLLHRGSWAFRCLFCAITF